MKNGRPEGEKAESMPVHLDLRPEHQTGDTGGRPSGRSSFQGAPDAKFFMGLAEKDRRSRGGGKSGNPAAVAGFPSAEEKSCLWTFPRNGFFHGPCTQRLCT
jgi:hypothetical protein